MFKSPNSISAISSGSIGRCRSSGLALSTGNRAARALRRSISYRSKAAPSSGATMTSGDFGFALRPAAKVAGAPCCKEETPRADRGFTMAGETGFGLSAYREAEVRFTAVRIGGVWDCNKKETMMAVAATAAPARATIEKEKRRGGGAARIPARTRGRRVAGTSVLAAVRRPESMAAKKDCSSAKASRHDLHEARCRCSGYEGDSPAVAASVSDFL